MGENEPKDPNQDPLYGATPQQTGAGPKVPQPDASKQDGTGEGSNSSVVPEETANPLYGATPSELNREEATDTSSPQDRAKERLESTSRDRVRDLKAARENALAGSSSPAQASLQAPTGPSQHVDPGNASMATPPPSIPVRPTHAPIPYRPSPLPGYLRRLSYILSILLGTGATIASIWSLFLLPLLHASFSARRALVEQQLERWTGLAAGLRQMRQKGMYALPLPSAEGEEKSGAAAEGEKGGHSTTLEQRARAMVEEISSVASASGGDADQQACPPQPTPLLPELSDVISSVGELAATRGNTSTTRTSLLSTLESYTSNLHRQLWSPRPGHGYSGYGVGLNSLDANLAKERGGIATDANGIHAAGGELAMGVKGEEYDAVRKEIRAIKGILLNRRNFDLAR